MKCNKHPKYKAIFEPRGGCPECLKIWSRKNKLIKAKAAAFDDIMAELHAADVYDLPDNVFIVREKYTGWDWK